MSTNALYLTVMLGIIAVILVASVPSLFFRKCPKCATRNGIGARTCKRCGTAFPDEE